MMNWIKHIARSSYTRWKFRDAQIAFSARVSLDSRLGKGVRILEKSQLGNCTIGRFAYVGVNSQLTDTEIGAFTSIGRDVLCGLGKHPLEYVTTYPGFYTPHASGATWFGATHPFADSATVHIGSDVWIGSRSIIMGGVRIGHGAVIGAGAVVTKDVPDYAIVGGVPARLLRSRFNTGLCQRLLESRWWEAPENLLRELAPYATDPEAFLYHLNKR